MDRMKETAVEMGKIIKKMREHMPESFFWNHVLLAAILAITARNNGSAVKAILFLSLRDVGHDKFFLKISTKALSRPFFFH